MVLYVIIVLVFLVALLGSIGLACGYPQLDVKQSRGRVYSPVEEADLDAIQWPLGGSAVIGPLVEPAENALPLRYRSPLLDRPPNPDLDIVYSHLGKSVRREYCIIQDVAVIERLRQNGYTCKPTHADWYETNFSVEKNGLHVLPSGQTLYVRGTQLLLSAKRDQSIDMSLVYRVRSYQPTEPLQLISGTIPKSLKVWLMDDAVVMALRQNGYVCKWAGKNDGDEWYKTNCPVESGEEYMLPDGQILFSYGARLSFKPVLMDPAEGHIVNMSSIPIGEAKPKECQEDMQFAPADWRKP